MSTRFCQEQWVQIKSHPHYEISDHGRLRRGQRILNPRANMHTGLLQINLSDEGRKTTHFVHRLVADAFYPNVPQPNVVQHINGHCRDNRACNLRVLRRVKNLTGEVWHPIPKHSGYQISNKGRIKSTIRSNHVLLTPLLTPCGKHWGVFLRRVGAPGKSQRCLVKHLVAEAFLPDYEQGCTVTVKNGRLKDCRSTNLEIVKCKKD